MAYAGYPAHQTMMEEVKSQEAFANDIPEMKRKLDQLVSSPELRVRLAQRGLEYAERFSAMQTTQTYAREISRVPGLEWVAPALQPNDHGCEFQE